MEQDFPGSREIIGQALRSRGTPAAALETTLASISNATIAQYAKPLRLWWHFCRQRGAPCFSPSVSQVLDFLSSLLPDVRSYSTLNTYRSAVSLLSPDEVGSHALVRRFLRGVAALKPQRPRYDFVWDPSPVLSYLATLFPHEGLTLGKVSGKLVTLMALTTAQRMQTLAAIQVSNMVLSDRLVIRIPARLKTSGIGRFQPLLSFRPFPDRPELCVFSLMKFYLGLTRELRQEGCGALFISLRPPHKSVSSQTLGRWVKAVLEVAGVDTSIFSAHSTRHASTSFAAGRGISVDEIRRTAGWTRSSEVFARFYNRPIIETASLQTAIINSL